MNSNFSYIVCTRTYDDPAGIQQMPIVIFAYGIFHRTSFSYHFPFAEIIYASIIPARLALIIGFLGTKICFLGTLLHFLVQVVMIVLTVLFVVLVVCGTIV